MAVLWRSGLTAEGLNKVAPEQSGATFFVAEHLSKQKSHKEDMTLL